MSHSARWASASRVCACATKALARPCASRRSAKAEPAARRSLRARDGSHHASLRAAQGMSGEKLSSAAFDARGCQVVLPCLITRTSAQPCISPSLLREASLCKRSLRRWRLERLVRIFDCQRLAARPVLRRWHLHAAEHGAARETEATAPSSVLPTVVTKMPSRYEMPSL